MRRFAFIVTVVGVFLLLGSGTAFSATVSITGTSGETELWVPAGTQFDVQLYLYLDSAEEEAITSNGITGITGFTIDIQWDELVSLIEAPETNYTYIEYYDADVTNPHGEPRPVPSLPWVGNTLELYGYKFSDPFTTSHELAILRLVCNGAGDTDLIPYPHHTVTTELGNFGTNDPYIFLENVTTVDYQGLTIHQTPIPPAIFLLGGGLLGLLGIRIRKP